ncbi:putative E3 ubiquitin-protein ligase RF298 [Typha latifolia]|uniref:putative E3 ubiquitin-protein ligase RF298 n=1 Tax=Typha latifolia TaxID=4733 RepID=UPI003C2C6F64
MDATSGNSPSSPIPTQENKNKNKGKMEDDPPSQDVNGPNSITDTLDGCPFCESRPIEELLNKYNINAYARVCRDCRSVINRLKKELNLEDILDYQWYGNTRTELEKIVLIHLHYIYSSAIKRITSYGYTQVVATNAILVTCNSSDCEDPGSSVAETALRYLASGQKVDTSERENAAEELKVLVKEVLDNMVSEVKELQPFLGTGDAMWLLLLHDMNLSKTRSACLYPAEDHVSAKLRQELKKRLPQLYAAASIPNTNPSYSTDEEEDREEDREKKAKVLLEMQELRDQVQDSMDWLWEKIIQVTQRLREDKPELHKLRKQREEAQRQNEKEYFFEDSKYWSSAELEKARRMCYAEEERLRGVMRWIEAEKSKMKKEAISAKERDAGFAAGCQEALLKEMKYNKAIESLERYNGKLQEELSALKLKSSELLPQLSSFRKCQIKLEAKWKKENKLKESALLQVDAKRKEHDKILVSAQLKEEAFKLQNEANSKKYRDDTEKLEAQIWSSLVNFWKNTTLEWEAGDASVHSEIIDSQELGTKTAARDLECAMCLAEEVSVVFLPCAHQVVCTKCNEQHEKNGLRECPSCRTPIQRRIIARSAST